MRAELLVLLWAGRGRDRVQRVEEARKGRAEVYRERI